MTWTPDELPDLTGTTAVVTGANSGIGFETACALARHGVGVTLACRNVAAAEQAAVRIRNSHKGAGGPGGDGRGADVRVAELDLSSLASVRSFTDAWQGPLHLLVNNAGVMAPYAWQGTTDGFELQFGTNHLGHFALTGLLLGALRAGGSSRVVTVSSLAHHGGHVDVIEGNPPETRRRPESAYGNSKLANLRFGAELQRRARCRWGQAEPVCGGRGRARLVHRSEVAAREPRARWPGTTERTGPGPRARIVALAGQPGPDRRRIPLEALSAAAWITQGQGLGSGWAAAAFPRPRRTYSSASAPPTMPATQAHGHQCLSP